MIMSILLGVFCKQREPLPASWGQAMIAASELWPHDRVCSQAFPYGQLICLQQFNTPQSPLARQPIACQDRRFHLIFDGRIDNRKELADKVNIVLTDEITDETLILAAYCRYGSEVSQELIGDFAIGIYDQQAHALFLIRDHHGVRPLFFTENSQYFAFASTKKALLSLPWIDRTTNEQWIADFLADMVTDASLTTYQGLKSLGPAHRLLLEQGRAHIKQYWQLDLSRETCCQTDEEYIEHFTALLFEAIQCRLRSYNHKVASELSGGLDSTTITAVAAKISHSNQGQLFAFSHVMHPTIEGKIWPFKDEKAWIHLLLKRYSNIIHQPIYSRNRGVIETIMRTLEVHGTPTRSPLVMMADEAFEWLQKENIRVLLSGFGGDQLVTHNAGGWKRELALQPLSWINRWQQALYYSGSRQRALHALLSMLKQKYARPERSYRKEWQQRSKRFDTNPHFAKVFGYPAHYFANPFRPATATVRELQFKITHSGEITHRTEDCAIEAASYGVDYRYPLLDIRLQQFCLSLPLTQKIRAGMGRRMIRVATKGILPDEVRLRNDKSRAAMPTVVQRLIYEKEALQTLLPQLKLSPSLQAYVRLSVLEMGLSKLDGRFHVFPWAINKILSLHFWLEKKVNTSGDF